jgi:sterol desaturase/sphingolipid hydroxylase (fatty acid hydroxylase superfamily)
VTPYLLFPLVVSAITAYALLAPGIGALSSLSWPGDAYAGVAVISALVIFYPMLALLERLLPYRSDWNRSHGDVLADALHLTLTGTISQGLMRALVVGPLTLLSASVANAAGGPLWPSQWPMLAQLALALVLGELGHYAFHRLTHENQWLWRLHAVHHAAPRLYWLNATRFQVLDLFLIISFESVPLALLGAGAEVLGPYFIFRAVYGQVQHCNIDMRTPPWIDWLWSSPNVHRWHHSLRPLEGNHNYGAVLNVWDHVFRSFFRPALPFAGPVGIDRIPDFPSSYLAQQLSPFRWNRVSPQRGTHPLAPSLARECRFSREAPPKNGG